MVSGFGGSPILVASDPQEAGREIKAGPPAGVCLSGTEVRLEKPAFQQVLKAVLLLATVVPSTPLDPHGKAWALC